jgi:hypothetical protein
VSKGKIAFILAVLGVFVYLFFFYTPEMGLEHRRATGIKFVNEGKDVGRKPCVIEGYYRAKDSWDYLCAKYPFKAGEVISNDDQISLRIVGILCEGWKLPTVDKVNQMCDYYCKK